MNDYKDFSRQDLLDRLGALGEEWLELIVRKEDLLDEMKHIEELLKEMTKGAQVDR